MKNSIHKLIFIIKTPFRKFRNLLYEKFRKNNFRRLKSHDFSIISNRCGGGIISHSCCLEHKSPTVNLSFGSIEEFVIFANNIREFLNLEIIDDGWDKKEGCPRGKIESKFGTVHIIFNHYENFSVAKAKWDSRKKRVNYDRLLFHILIIEPLSEKEIELINSITSKCCSILSSKKIEGIQKDNFLMPKLFANYEPGKINLFVKMSLKPRKYIDEFDYVRWINKCLDYYNN